MKRWLLVLLCWNALVIASDDIPYYDQKQNSKEGNRTCAITSMAMVLDYYQITLPTESGQRTPDWLYQKFGVVQDEWDLQALFNRLARDAARNIRDHFYERGTIAQLRERASKGLPTVVHGWFTESGHVVVVIGFDGMHYRVHDPYGRWLGKVKAPSAQSYDVSVSGNAQRYDAMQFEAAINDNGTGDDLWLHIFESPR